MSAAISALAQAPASKRAAAPRFVMIGGFLGAGKTTIATRLGSHLKAAGHKVALITNDEGAQIVDTHIFRARGFETEQISGGSFGSNFDELTAASARLAIGAEPDVYIAEPVGSCTDLIATVRNAMSHLHGESFAAAPFTVVVDPVRALRVFGLERGAAFSEKILYIYRKQLEEADVILINKIDAVPSPALSKLEQHLAREFPHARITKGSARSGSGLEPWFAAVMNDVPPTRVAMDLDYAAYGEGEALLGWLDCAVQLSAMKGFACNPVLIKLAAAIMGELRDRKIEIAHLKMSLAADVDVDGVATLNLVRSELEPEVGEELEEPVERGHLYLNLRAEGKPDHLHAAVTNAMTHVWLKFPNILARLTHMEHFRPGSARPTHRFAEAQGTVF